MAVFSSRKISFPDSVNYVNYIKSNGTQYIDTGYQANQNTRIVMDVEPSDNGVDSWFFDGRHAANSNSFGVYVQYSLTAKPYYSDYGTSRLQLSGVAPTERILIDFNKNVATVGGVTVTHSASTFQSSYNLNLLCVNTAGTRKGYLVGKLYSCQIFDNNVLIRDYRPCLDPSGVACLYDKVNREYVYDANGNNFTAGGFSPTEVDYVDYIQSNGTQYINTGFNPNNNTRIVMDAQFVGATDQSKLYTPFGVRGGNYFFELYKASSSNWNLTFLWNKTYNQYFTIDYSARHIFEINKNVATVDETSLTYTSATFQLAYPLYLCADNNAGTADAKSPLKIYSCQIYDNGTLVRDYLPCRDPLGVACLFDKIEGMYYYNAGTGDFTAPATTN